MEKSEELDELAKLREELAHEKAALERMREEIEEGAEYLPWVAPGCHKREGK